MKVSSDRLRILINTSLHSEVDWRASRRVEPF
jgi:hypothetical protein